MALPFWAGRFCDLWQRLGYSHGRAELGYSGESNALIQSPLAPLPLCQNRVNFEDFEKRLWYKSAAELGSPHGRRERQQATGNDTEPCSGRWQCLLVGTRLD
ncbi:MAG: hypothetical protein CMQ44_11685 [Gammaproteobacteria bacterium]|nr:hypothetical protein [Gammaproteobacteria bacterium]